jgi:hypothetical protein
LNEFESIPAGGLKEYVHRLKFNNAASRAHAMRAVKCPVDSHKKSSQTIYNDELSTQMLQVVDKWPEQKAYLRQ